MIAGDLGLENLGGGFFSWKGMRCFSSRFRKSIGE